VSKGAKASGERALTMPKTGFGSAGRAWEDFSEQVEAEGLESVGNFYVPRDDHKLRGILQGRIVGAEPEVDTFQANAGHMSDYAVKRLKEADPRVFVVVKRKKEDETDGEYLNRRRTESEAGQSSSSVPAHGKAGEEKASSSKGRGPARQDQSGSIATRCLSQAGLAEFNRLILRDAGKM